MTHDDASTGAAAQLASALAADDSSARLQAALTAGTRPDPAFVEVLVARCAREPDFYVRDMLTWALVRHDRRRVIERVLPELDSATPQARSQALHTLSKIGEPATWSAITSELMHDADDEVARTTWRTAAGLVPEGEAAGLAETLAAQFGRGDRDMQLSLSRAFAELGAAAFTAIESAKEHVDERVRVHAFATERIIDDPEESFDAAVAEARRTVALASVPIEPPES